MEIMIKISFMVFQVIFDLYIIYKFIKVGKIFTNHKEYIEDLVEAINIVWGNDPFLLCGYKPKTKDKYKKD